MKIFFKTAFFLIVAVFCTAAVNAKEIQGGKEPVIYAVVSGDSASAPQDKTDGLKLASWDASPKADWKAFGLGNFSSKPKDWLDSSSTFIHDKVFQFTETAFRRELLNTLKFIESSAQDFESESKYMDIDQIEVSLKVTAEGKLAIVSGSTEGSLKYVLKRKKKASDS